MFMIIQFMMQVYNTLHLTFPAYIYNDYYYAGIFDTSYEANLETKLHNQEFIIKEGSIMNSYYNLSNTTVICTVHTLFLRPS